ncbi:MAG: redoxin domain-containing protein [Actinobacteria bacterium]|nr:peroxiredoxin [Actinomycetota bacterium]NIU69279.1 peroxiredoxin [Actinomycetota bacterium]NIW31152.1 redoxin domain-containing protein [Actinomycetota bacterium]NIX23524.1 redoxin domain-containing protein [Actinomycetota bacterium]
MPLEPGDPAPSVAAEDQHGNPVELAFEQPTVLFFYPRDGTPGCTTEATQFEAERETYDEAGLATYGVSTDDVAAHAEFAERQGLEVTLLADPDGELAAAFDVPVENGRAARTTFVLADGEVHRVYRSVRPDGHARTVLGDLLDDGLAALDWDDAGSG